MASGIRRSRSGGWEVQWRDENRKQRSKSFPGGTSERVLNEFFHLARRDARKAQLAKNPLTTGNSTGLLSRGAVGQDTTPEGRRDGMREIDYRKDNTPLTARDTIAIAALRLKIGPDGVTTPPAELVAWAFEVADEFVKRSTAHWAEKERADKPQER